MVTHAELDMKPILQSHPLTRMGTPFLESLWPRVAPPMETEHQSVNSSYQEDSTVSYTDPANRTYGKSFRLDTIKCSMRNRDPC